MTAAQSRNFEILIDGEQIPDDHFISFTCDRDMNQPDMAAIVLSNQGNVYSGKKIGAPIEVQIGDPPESIYKGEIVGLEPHYQGGGKTTLLIRAMNRLHRLLRKRKSITFVDKTDQQILTQVVGDSGMTLDWSGGPSFTYKHVYQHNLTDLEFVRQRAGRLGMHVWCVDTTVHCKFPELQRDSQIELALDPDKDGIGLKAFRPKLSSAGIVKSVTIKGWNPETKELITGTYESQTSSLGSTHAADASGDLGSNETFSVDTPVWSTEEAKALAHGRHSDISLGYVTGTIETLGSAKFDLGMVVKITVGASDPFNGRYYIMGLTHRHAGSSKDGMSTILRVARDAQDG
jgi:phage protein D